MRRSSLLNKNYTRKVLALLLAFIFAFTLIPEGSVVFAAEEDTDIVILEDEASEGVPADEDVEVISGPAETITDESLQDPEIIEVLPVETGSDEPGLTEMPEDEMTVSEDDLRDEVTSYPLWVEGVQVTDDNKDSLNWNKAVFDPETNTLTLNNADISSEFPSGSSLDDNKYNAGIYSELASLHIVINGDNTIRLWSSHTFTDSLFGVWSTGDIDVSGTGSLVFDTANISSSAKDTITGIRAANVEITGVSADFDLDTRTFDTFLGIDAAENVSVSRAVLRMEVNQSLYTTRFSAGIKAGGTVSLGSGTVLDCWVDQYNAELNAGICSSNIVVSREADITINCSNSYAETTAYGFYSDQDSADFRIDSGAKVEITCGTAAFSAAPGGSFLTGRACVNTDATSTNCFVWDGETDLTAYKYFSYPGTVTYGIWIQGTEVTENNYSDVLGDGSVSYDPQEKRLTLNNAEIYSANVSRYYSGIENIGILLDSDVNISLIGENHIYITPVSDGSIYSYGISNPHTTSVSGSGSLNVSFPETTVGRYIYGIQSYNFVADGTTIVSDVRVPDATGKQQYAYGIYADQSRINNASITCYGADAVQRSCGAFLGYNTTVRGTSAIYGESGAAPNGGYGVYLEYSYIYDQSTLTGVNKEGDTSNYSYGIYFSSSELTVYNDAAICAISAHQAFYRAPRLRNNNRTAWINTEPTAEGRILWDRSTQLNSSDYKYVAVPGADGYEVWVQGVHVDGANSGDVLGDGTVSYDPRTETLTLNGASLTAVEGDYQSNLEFGDLAAIGSTHDLNVVLEGENTVALEPQNITRGEYICAFSIKGSLNIKGSGRLGVSLDSALSTDEYLEVSPVFASGDIAIESSSIGISVTGDPSDITTAYGIVSGSGTVSIAGASVDIDICGCSKDANSRAIGICSNSDMMISSTSTVAVDIGGGSNSMGIVANEKAVISGNADVGVSAIGTVSGLGINSPSIKISDEAVLEAAGSAKALSSAPDISGMALATAYVNTSVSAEGRYAWNGSSALGGDGSSFRYVRLPGETVYEIWVGGVQITEHNRDDVLGDGKVSYDHQTHTLTLDNAEIISGYVGSMGGYYGIASRTGISIVLEGTNTVFLGTPETDMYSYSLSGIRYSGQGDLRISGSGSLAIREGDVFPAAEETIYLSGIFSDEPVIIEDVAIIVDLSGRNATQITGFYFDDSASITDASINITGGKASDYEYGIFSFGTITIGGSSTVSATLQAMTVSNTPTSCLGLYVYAAEIKDEARVSISAGSADESYGFSSLGYLTAPFRIKDKAYVTAIGNTRAFEAAPDLSGYSELEPGASLAYVNNRATERGRSAWDGETPLDSEAAGYKYVRVPGPIPYSIWIEGTEITNDNCSDVKGDHTVSYDHETHTLTLTNASLRAASARDGEVLAAVYAYDTDLNIVLAGTNTITANSAEGFSGVYGIYSTISETGHSLNFSGDGSLGVTGPDDNERSFIGIAGDTVSFSGASVTVTGRRSNEIAGIEGAYITISDGAEVEVSAGEATGFNGGLAAAYGLSVEDDSSLVSMAGSGSESYGIMTGTGDDYDKDKYFTIKDTAQITAAGQNAAFSTEPDYSEYEGVPTAYVNSTASAENRTVWNGFDSLAGFKYVSLPGPEGYPVWVQGIRVHALNKDDILGDGKISYDPEAKKLSLNNAVIHTEFRDYKDSYTQYYGIYAGAGIEISLSGENTVNMVSCDSSNPYYSCGIYGAWDSGNPLIISGDGSLNITADESRFTYNYGIYAGSLTIRNASITSDLRNIGGDSRHYYAIALGCGDVMTIENAAVTAYGGKAVNRSVGIDTNSMYIRDGSVIDAEASTGGSSYGIQITNYCTVSGSETCYITAIAGESSNNKSIGLYSEHGNLRLWTESVVEVIGQSSALYSNPSWIGSLSAWVNTEPSAAGRTLWDGTTALNSTNYKYVRIPAIPVTGITLNEDSKLLAVGDTFELTAALTPENADCQGLQWSSSDESVAKVDEGGKVTAMGLGTAEITVSPVEDPAISAACTVKVTKLVTLTLRWSSVDGDDLMDPVVFSGIEAGTSISAVMSAAGRSWNSPFFTAEGYQDSLLRLRGPVTSYADDSAANGDRIYGSGVLEDDTEVFVFMKKNIDSVEVTVTSPESGSTTNTPKGAEYDWDNQTNPPVFEVPESSAYLPDADGCLPGYWVTEYDQDSEPFIGTFEDGGSYLAQIYLVPKYGYVFSDEPAVTANGADLITTYPDPAVFEVILSVPVTAEPDPQWRFPDVIPKDEPGWTVNRTSYDSIMWAADNGIAKGYANGNFGPEDVCTREQFTIMLWRFAGEPKANVSAVNRFKDAGQLGSSSKKAIAWAVEKGIINGFNDGTFKPKADITRAQVCVMLWRFAGQPKVTGSANFKDITKLSPNVRKAILWAQNKKIASGYSDGTFKPDNGCQRQHMAIFLNRYNKNVKQYKPY